MPVELVCLSDLTKMNTGLCLVLFFKSFITFHCSCDEHQNSFCGLWALWGVSASSAALFTSGSLHASSICLPSYLLPNCHLPQHAFWNTWFLERHALPESSGFPPFSSSRCDGYYRLSTWHDLESPWRHTSGYICAGISRLEDWVSGWQGNSNRKVNNSNSFRKSL